MRIDCATLEVSEMQLERARSKMYLRVTIRIYIYKSAPPTPETGPFGKIRFQAQTSTQTLATRFKQRRPSIIDHQLRSNRSTGPRTGAAVVAGFR